LFNLKFDFSNFQSEVNINQSHFFEIPSHLKDLKSNFTIIIQFQTNHQPKHSVR